MSVKDLYKLHAASCTTAALRPDEHHISDSRASYMILTYEHFTLITTHRPHRLHRPLPAFIRIQ